MSFFPKFLLVSLLLISGALSAADQIRLSQADGLGNVDGFAVDPDQAYNPDRDEVLVVWWGRDNSLGGVAGRLALAGQLVDASTGLAIGPIVRIDRNAGGENASRARVVYNTLQNEYLVVWANEDVATHQELFVQRLSAQGLQPLMTMPRQITMMGGAGDDLHSAYRPAVAFNPDRNEYLVAFVGSDSRVGMSDLDRDVFIQRLNGVDASEIGADDQRISHASDSGLSRKVLDEVDVTYFNGRYIVVWSADDARAGLAAGEYEIFSQMIGGNGLELGVDDSRLSTVGPTGNAFFDARQATITAFDNGVAVAFQADLVQGFKEVFAIKVNISTGMPSGAQTRLTISTSGVVSHPDLVWEPLTSRLLLAYRADDVLGPDPVFENEVFVQRFDSSLAPQGSRQRWSRLGPDGDPQFGPTDGVSIVAHGSPGGFLVAWSGDHDQGGQIEGEQEVFVRSSGSDRMFQDRFSPSSP